jgi:hypothetical protein
VKNWRPTLGGIQMASALIAGLGILAIADFVSFHLNSASLNYLFLEMGMVGVATALVAYMHVHDTVRFWTPMLILMLATWGITAVLLGPAMLPIIPLALIAALSGGTGFLRELRAKANN